MTGRGPRGGGRDRQTVPRDGERPAPESLDAPYIRDAEGLEALCAELAAQPAIALDIEFRRERTYRAKLELIQVATPSGPVIIDPLAIRDVSPLWRIVADPGVVKILHAASQDLEIYFAQMQIPPQAIFDTQIAAALVGLGEQIGYADLLARLIGVRLSKLETRTDWSQRPLTPGQIGYALDDVRYLHDVYAKLQARLQNSGRIEWMSQEMRKYEDPATYAPDPMRLALKMPRVRALARKQFNALVELTWWREQEAMERDEPRSFVLSDSLLVEIARRLPRTPDELVVLRGLHPRFAERYGRAVCAAVLAAAEREQLEVPDLPAPRSDDPERALLLDLLEVVVRIRARAAEIAPRYLCTRQDLADFLEAHDSSIEAAHAHTLYSSWRGKLIGHDVLALLDGRLVLRLDPATGRVTVSPPVPPSAAPGDTA